jgi:hypothetical protein
MLPYTIRVFQKQFVFAVEMRVIKKDNVGDRCPTWGSCTQSLGFWTSSEEAIRETKGNNDKRLDYLVKLFHLEWL